MSSRKPVGTSEPAPDESPPGASTNEALRRSQLSLDADFLRTIIEESNRCFFLIDPESQSLVYISPAFDRLWGRSRDELYRDASAWYRTIHPEDVERCRQAADVRLAGPDGRYPPFEYRIHRPTGEERWIRGNVFQCRNGNSGDALLCGIAEDITAFKRHDAERAAAQAQLEQIVACRTAELTSANEALRTEIDRRAVVENQLLEEQAMLERMLRFQEWDRRLTSLAIHDGAIQNVVAARLHIQAVADAMPTQAQVEKLQRSAELLQAAISESRRIVDAMRPQTLDDLGLCAALEELAAKHERQGLAVDLQMRYVSAGRSPMVETTIFRIVQESLTNVRLHAEADRARVQLKQEHDRLLLTIADEGRGFDTAKGVQGHGLHGLKARATAVGGTLKIESQPDLGTTIAASLPLLDPVDSATKERDRAAAALQVSRARIQQILDRTTAVIFIKDHEGRYELINHQHERLFHHARGDIIGKTDFDIFPADVARKLRENDLRVLTGGESITVEEAVPSDTEVRDYVVVKFAIPGETDGPPSICGIATDITEQKRQLQALEETRNRFQAFMDNSPLLAWIKDSDGRYVFANRRMLEVFGQTLEGIVGRTDFEVLPQGWAGPVREHDLDVLRRGGTHHYQEVCPVASGPPLTWHACKFRLQADDGSFLVGGLAVDVSDNGPTAFSPAAV